MLKQRYYTDRISEISSLGPVLPEKGGAVIMKHQMCTFFPKLDLLEIGTSLPLPRMLCYHPHLSVCLFVCLFVCEQDISRSYGRIFLEICTLVAYDQWKK